jgi:hypothetical protein
MFYVSCLVTRGTRPVDLAATLAQDPSLLVSLFVNGASLHQLVNTTYCVDINFLSNTIAGRARMQLSHTDARKHPVISSAAREGIRVWLPRNRRDFRPRRQRAAGHGHGYVLKLGKRAECVCGVSASQFFVGARLSRRSVEGVLT